MNISAALAALTLFLALLSAVGSAATEPSPAPATTASPSPAPKRFYRPGVTFASLSAEIAPAVRSEFHTTPSSTGTSIQAWSAGELHLGPVQLLTTTDYRTYSYAHAQINPQAACPSAQEPGCVRIVGPHVGSVNVAPFTARESELEGLTGLGVGQRFYLAVGTLAKTNNYGYSKLNGIGYGFGRAPSPLERISPYFSYVAYPNLGGVVATGGGNLGFSYKGVHYRFGSLFEIGESHLYLDAGLIGTRLESRAAAPSDVRDSAGYAGLAVRF